MALDKWPFCLIGASNHVPMCNTVFIVVGWDKKYHCKWSLVGNGSVLEVMVVKGQMHRPFFILNKVQIIINDFRASLPCHLLMIVKLISQGTYYLSNF